MWVCKSDLKDPLIFSPKGYLYNLYSEVRFKLANLICGGIIKDQASIIRYQFFRPFGLN